MKNIKKTVWMVITGIAALASCGGNAPQEKTAETPAADTVAVVQVRDSFPDDKWMIENKQKEGVTEIDGIQYRVITEGTGKQPNRRSRVKLNFDTRLTNGKVVESHWGKDVMELPVSKVIPGLQNALRLMPVGSTWEIYIPWDLAYGEEGAKNIPPHSALIFKVKLLDIVM